MSESFIKTWVIEPHTPDDPAGWAALGGEGLFLAWALGDLARGKFKSSAFSLIYAGLFYSMNRWHWLGHLMGH